MRVRFGKTKIKHIKHNDTFTKTTSTTNTSFNPDKTTLITNPYYQHRPPCQEGVPSYQHHPQYLIHPSFQASPNHVWLVSRENNLIFVGIAKKQVTFAEIVLNHKCTVFVIGAGRTILISNLAPIANSKGRGRARRAGVTPRVVVHKHTIHTPYPHSCPLKSPHPMTY